MGSGAQQEDKIRVAMAAPAWSIRRVYWVGRPLGSFLALTSSLALFLQVIVNFLSSPSPKRVRWVGPVLTHPVRGPGVPFWPGGSRPPETQTLVPACHVPPEWLSLPSVPWGAVFSASHVGSF